MTQLTIEKRNKIFLLAQQGYSERTIARKLKCSERTVRRWKPRPIPTNISPVAPGQGRKRKLHEISPSKIKSLSQSLERRFKALSPEVG